MEILDARLGVFVLRKLSRRHLLNILVHLFDGFIESTDSLSFCSNELIDGGNPRHTWLRPKAIETARLGVGLVPDAGFGTGVKVGDRKVKKLVVDDCSKS